MSGSADGLDEHEALDLDAVGERCVDGEDGAEGVPGGRGLRVLVGVPGVEEAAGEFEALLTEELLDGESFGVEAEVSLEVAPTGLAAFGVDLVVGPPAVGAADASEPLAEEFLEPVAVTIRRDPEDRRPGRGRSPERAVVPGLTQPVSSTLTAGEPRTDATSASCGSARAIEPRRQIASTAPTDNRIPNRSRASSDMSRRETRLRAVSVTIAACSLGPNAEPATAAGNPAAVLRLQHGQRKRCVRCSVTITVIGGSSAT